MSDLADVFYQLLHKQRFIDVFTVFYHKATIYSSLSRLVNRSFKKNSFDEAICSCKKIGKITGILPIASKTLN